MRRGATATAVAGILGSILLSGLLWWYFETAVFFLFVPFVPFLIRYRTGSSESINQKCPVCGFHTKDDSYEYCPKDGARLE
jgi:hypothetical protein